jgi:DNA-binding MarR family transcriptional regulator
MREESEGILGKAKRIDLALEADLNARLKGWGLTASQGRVLRLVLAREGGICSTDVQRALGLTRGTVSGLVKKLREKGYLAFAPDARDERSKPVIATQKALAMQDRLERCQSTLEARALRGFTKEERAALGAMQDKLLCNLCYGKRKEKEAVFIESHTSPDQTV